MLHGAWLVSLTLSRVARRISMTPPLEKVLARMLLSFTASTERFSPHEHRYVIDTGIEVEHPEFQGRTYRSSDH
jgi:hypothetical protein